MNILVCISNVPDTTSKINFIENDTIFDTNGIQFIINPYDEFGLTKAIKLREQHGGKVTVLNVGTNQSDPTLRKALAIGADEAVRINTEPLDSFSVSKEIASHIKSHNYELIIMGRESIDYNGGAVPGMLAELLGYSFVNATIGLNINDSEAEVIREIEGGKEHIKTQLPLIVAGQKGIVEESDLLIPNMRGIMSARSKPLNVEDATCNDSKTRSISFEMPDQKSQCKMIDSGNESELIALLHNEAKVI